MEFKDLTVEMLSSERADLVGQLRASGKKDGVKEERVRVLSIVKLANKEFSGIDVETIVDKSIETGKSFSEANAEMLSKRLVDLQKTEKPGPDGESQASAKDHLTRAKEYKAAHPECKTMTKALQATAAKRK